MASRHLLQTDEHCNWYRSNCQEEMRMYQSAKKDAFISRKLLRQRVAYRGYGAACLQRSGMNGASVFYNFEVSVYLYICTPCMPDKLTGILTENRNRGRIQLPYHRFRFRCFSQHEHSVRGSRYLWNHLHYHPLTYLKVISPPRLDILGMKSVAVSAVPTKFLSSLHNVYS